MIVLLMMEMSKDGFPYAHCPDSIARQFRSIVLPDMVMFVVVATYIPSLAFSIVEFAITTLVTFHKKTPSPPEQPPASLRKTLRIMTWAVVPISVISPKLPD